jgi:RND superfamily putative drug exporter
MLIPAVSVLASITLLPAMLSMLGPRINSLRVMPRRIVEGSDDTSSGFWSWWANVVTRHAALTAAAGLAIVAALLYAGVQLNPSESQAKDMPGGGDAIAGRQALAAAGISAGAFKPFEILVEGRPSASQLTNIARRVARAPGVAGAVAPVAWRTGSAAIVEAIPAADGSSAATKRAISQLEHGLLPALAADSGLQVTLGGIAAEDQDFVHAVYGNFGYVLLFVVLLTYILLARAFRSLILPLKAVILNLVSLGAAYGIIVIIFQWGHGAEAIWNVPSTNSIIPWIPLMIFAFLYGLSMDYEVFIVARMRESYDALGSTRDAVVEGIGRTGRLVTSAALVLVLAFASLASGPIITIKVIATGLAVGILLDATVVRSLLVPALVELFGTANWWLPRWASRALRTSPEPRQAPSSHADKFIGPS